MEAVRSRVEADVGGDRPGARRVVKGLRVGTLMDVAALGERAQETGFQAVRGKRVPEIGRLFRHRSHPRCGSGARLLAWRRVARQSAGARPAMIHAIGLMSGTSADGVDAAAVETDGRDRVSCGPWLTMPYDAVLRTRLRALDRNDRAAIDDVAAALTDAHAAARRRVVPTAVVAPPE